MFGPKTAIFAPKYAFLGTYMPRRVIWCPVGWLVGGCGARLYLAGRLFTLCSRRSIDKSNAFCSRVVHAKVSRRMKSGGRGLTDTGDKMPIALQRPSHGARQVV